MMDVSSTVIPKSDQINFEDVQSQEITSTIKSVRAGSRDQPVFIDLIGFDGRPYKPSKSMRRVLVEAWGNDGHSWVGRSLTLYGDPTVQFGGVAVGGIKIRAMSDIEADFSLMLSVSRGKRQEHRVRKLEVKKSMTPAEILAWFSSEALTADMTKLNGIYSRTKAALSAHPDESKKMEEVYSARKGELEVQ
ncbi:hypothetical protein [Klebsiella oxytoca]|uniref:hypothetical protein n=1 Tax=Klebsiella oxytoca TaxID=571 RepID=UPI0025994752|nr:hypothetical protein [Klebsiella oxytoca]MDM4157333.1 hypothetical protein [Klebsiella oxytoca]MDM4190630.1 hypothetical protein [Klebsiella oxytoca]MDM4224014.1 hypothetical protein [Klebsiella oxytoca]MDM4238155.1 hypothetical protein [Klebsiella oxytoca]MDM4334613.1 hypothetical protein [Klebsiella oxytoca]